MSSAEVLIAEVHVVLLLGEFVHLTKLVHVELANEGGEVLVAEIVRQYLLL